MEVLFLIKANSEITLKDTDMINDTDMIENKLLEQSQ
jgi:hypothetical protein